MLTALRDGGTNAVGFDIVPKDAEWIGTDLERFAEGLETLFIVVRDEAQVRELLFDTQKLISIAQGLNRIVLCSTISPRAVPYIAARLPEHIAIIDAPISGAVAVAENRKLTFMLGGTESDIQEVTPLLATMGDAFYHMGPLGAGMQAKVLNNLLLASNTAVTRLVLDWADQAGLDGAGLRQLIHNSSGQNWFASNFETHEFSLDGHAPRTSLVCW